MPPAYVAISTGGERFTAVKVPILAIFADPHDPGPGVFHDAKARAAFVANDQLETDRTVDAFQAGMPQAHVVRIANASHYIFHSNEAQVLQEIDLFMTHLSP